MAKGICVYSLIKSSCKCPDVFSWAAMCEAYTMNIGTVRERGACAAPRGERVA